MTSATIAVEPDHLLSPAVTAHCFWAASCRHAVTDTPIAAHDAMERHYTQRHQDDIRKIVGRYAPPTRKE